MKKPVILSTWNEMCHPSGDPRPEYARMLHCLENQPANERRILQERLDATLREMGVTFAARGASPWSCDLLPQIFTPQEWDLIRRGMLQRLNAFECFLKDVYGKREILRSGSVPVSPVLASPHYQTASVGIPSAQNAYLHLSGLCITRGTNGRLMVKQHFFSRASGISYMMQNRRGLARVAPEHFQHESVVSLAETPLSIIEHLRDCAANSVDDPMVVMLSSGPASAVYSDHSFLARRMGVPLVQGGDLLVLNDCVYLKTVQGLKRVDVIYSRVADAWVDPLVFRNDSMLGVPGLVQCLRKGTVSIVNAIGSQLADDRSLLCFSSRIIRFYLGEDAILPTMPTYLMGDLDQREMVAGDPEKYVIRPIFGDDLSATMERVYREADIWEAIRKSSNRFVAQPRGPFGTTLRIDSGKVVEAHQDHIVFALRSTNGFEVFPGALTRVFSTTEPDKGWSSKDSWVLSGENPTDSSELSRRVARPRRLARRKIGKIGINDPKGRTGNHSHPSEHGHSKAQAQTREVTSRVADAFYWLGRYLERAHHEAYLIQAIETLETEELNSAERRLYRPMWNRLLPPIETKAGTSRRSITNRFDRYRLLLLPQPGSVASTVRSAINNAKSIQECISPEAWSALITLQSRFDRIGYKEKVSDETCARTARNLSENVTALIPQFFAIAGDTMLADDGWRFCQVGAFLERSIITANSMHSISESLTRESHGTEIELSAFLRLLGTRDAYRRVYQGKAEPIAVLELLWQNPEAPRSVLRCLTEGASLLTKSSPPDTSGARRALDAFESLKHRIIRIDWSAYLPCSAEDELPKTGDSKPELPTHQLKPLLGELLASTLDLHHLISDGFLSHQGNIAQAAQPLLAGF